MESSSRERDQSPTSRMEIPETKVSTRGAESSVPDTQAPLEQTAIDESPTSMIAKTESVDEKHLDTETSKKDVMHQRVSTSEDHRQHTEANVHSATHREQRAHETQQGAHAQYFRIEYWVAGRSDRQIADKIYEIQMQYQEMNEKYSAQKGKYRSLERQFRELQDEMLSSRNRFQPVTDGSFKKMLGEVDLSVKRLSQKLRRSLGANSEAVTTALKGKTLTLSIEAHCWEIKKDRPLLIRSTIWQWLLESMFSNTFQAYGDMGRNASEMWKMLFGEDPSTLSKDPPRTEQAEQWRSATIAALHEGFRRGSFSRETYLRDVEQSLFDLVEYILGTRTERTSWAKEIASVIQSALNLADAMSKQYCRLELLVPALIQEETIEQQVASTNGREMYDHYNPEQVDVRPLFVVVPGIRKWGDGWGTNLGESMIVEPAAVKTDGEAD